MFKKCTVSVVLCVLFAAHLKEQTKVKGSDLHSEVLVGISLHSWRLGAMEASAML